VSSREGAITVGTFSLVSIVNPSGSNVKIIASAAVVIVLVPSALC
jgi:hypothetical protein